MKYKKYGFVFPYLSPVINEMKQNKKIMDNIEKNVCVSRAFELANKNRNKTERLKLIIQFVVSIVVVLSLNNNLFEIDKSPPSSVIIRT